MVKLRDVLIGMILGGITGVSQSCIPSSELELHWQWKKAGSIPEDKNWAYPNGLAGAAAGVSEEVLILAGGSNFPDAVPWAGGHKTYYDKGYVYEKQGDSLVSKKESFRLPYKVAYSANVSTSEGVFVAGGENESGALSTVLLLKWNSQKENMQIDSIPPLPIPLTSGALAALGHHLYFAGGQNADGVSDQLYEMDLNQPEEGWVHHSKLPYPVSHTVLLCTDNSYGKALYLIGGRKENPGGLSTLYPSVYRYNLKEEEWEERASLPFALAAQTGISWKDDGLLIFSGDRGETFHATEKLIAQINTETDSIRRRELITEKDEVQKNHPGFENQILYYDTNHDIWKKIGKIPFPGQVTTTALNWGDEIIIPGGEIRAGIRTSDIIVGKP